MKFGIAVLTVVGVNLLVGFELVLLGELPTTFCALERFFTGMSSNVVLKLLSRMELTVAICTTLFWDAKVRELLVSVSGWLAGELGSTEGTQKYRLVLGLVPGHHIASNECSVALVALIRTFAFVEDRGMVDHGCSGGKYCATGLTDTLTNIQALVHRLDQLPVVHFQVVEQF